MKTLFLVILAAVLCAGCDDKPQKITGVTRVFMQNEGKYILYVQQPGSSDVKTITIDAGEGNKIRVVTDVPDGQAAWFEGIEDGVTSRNFGTLHIHDLKQIEGAEDVQHRARGHTIRNQNAPVE